MSKHGYNVTVVVIQVGCLLVYKEKVVRDLYPEEVVLEVSLGEMYTNMWEFKD